MLVVVRQQWPKSHPQQGAAEYDREYYERDRPRAHRQDISVWYLESEGWAYITVSRSIIGDAAYFDAEWSVHPAPNNPPWCNNNRTDDWASNGYRAARANTARAIDAGGADHRICILRAHGYEASCQQ